MTEQWRTAIVNGEPWENYQVSNFGRILSLNYNHTGKPELMTPRKRKNGYFQVNLRKNGEYKTCSLHRLVAQTFIPNPNNLPQVNHIDQDKTNNRVENLEWKSPKDNCNHGTRNERIAKANTNGKLSKKVLQFTLNGKLIREWPSIMECERNGFNSGNVCKCCNGKKPQYKGFRFMYEDDYKEKQFKELGCLPLW